jgi:hypothetical protein
VTKFLKHCKKAKAKAKDATLAKIISSSKDSNDLIQNLKKEIISSADRELEEIKQRLTTSRKQGEDCLIEELRLMSLPSKIRLFDATENKDDLNKIKQIINSLKA